MKKNNTKINYPCYCCGRDVTVSNGHYVITKDGCNLMTHAEWKLLCAEVQGYNPADPRTAYNLVGCKWRPETFGSTCYKKHKSSNDSIEILTDDGSKWLFKK